MGLLRRRPNLRRERDCSGSSEKRTSSHIAHIPIPLRPVCRRSASACLCARRTRRKSSAFTGRTQRACAGRPVRTRGRGTAGRPQAEYRALTGPCEAPTCQPRRSSRQLIAASVPCPVSESLLDRHSRGADLVSGHSHARVLNRVAASERHPALVEPFAIVIRGPACPWRVPETFGSPS